MIGKIGSALADYLTGIGFDAGKDFILAKKEEKEIRSELHQYIENQRKYNEMCSLAEEIDFEGIIEYLQGNFMDDIRNRLFGKREERGLARETIINKAVGYSSATTDEAKKKTAKFVANAVDILRSYYRNQSKKEDLLLAAEVEDTVIDEIKRSEGNLQAYIDRVSPFSVDSYLHLAQKKDLETIEDNINMTLKAISCTHPLFPDYKYHFISGENGIQMISMPTSAEVYQKCPPKIICKGRVKVGDKYVNRFDTDIVDYANRHQLTIAIDINEAKKLLGDIEDPIQLEANRMIGTTSVIPPKPFPATLPCSIKVNGKIVYEYIELRIKEILDDGTYIITNEEQEDINVRVTVKAKLISGQVNVDIRTVNATNKDLLQYVRFMKGACEKGKLSIYVLSLGKDLMSGDFNDYDYDGGFATVDEEISFLEKIVLLEKYFHRSIKIPSEIYEKDIDSIEYLTELIENKKAELTWTGKVLTVPVTLDEVIKEHLSDLDENPLGITVFGDANVNLFNEIYHLPIIRTFESATIRDLEQVKKKVEVLEAGDILKLRYVPGVSDKLIDRLEANPRDIEE